MDTSKAKKNGKAQDKERDFIMLIDHSVDHVRVIDGKDGKGDIVFFTANINGVSINNCRVMTGKNGDFIAFPEQKGKDGNYYKIVYVSLSDDSQKAILKDVQDAINNM